MRLILTLTTDRGEFITQAEARLPESDLDLTPQEFSFKHCLWNRAIEGIQTEARFFSAMKQAKFWTHSSEVH